MKRSPFVLFLTLLAALYAPSGAWADDLPPNTKVLRDVEYIPGGGHSHSLDLYLPEKKPGAPAPPLIIWIHGGAWRSGDKDPNKAAWLVKNGFATAAINYRLSGEARFPAQLEDCKAAVRFLRARAGEYGIDPDHFGVWGSSAGGNLAALLGTTGGLKEFDVTGENSGVSSRVQAVCDFFAPSDLLTMSAQAGNEGSVNHDDPNSAEAQLVGGPVQQNTEKAWAASPVSYVTPDDPPFLIIHGDHDSLVPVGQSWELHGALQRAGVPSTIHVIVGGGHGDHFDYKEIGPMVRDFFEKILVPHK